MFFSVWFVLMGLLTGLCIGPLPALLRLLTQLTALQANYNSACLLRLNVCNDLAKAMKALDGKKNSAIFGNVALIVAGSLNMQTTELFKTFQDVIVPERPAVHCSMHQYGC